MAKIAEQIDENRITFKEAAALTCYDFILFIIIILPCRLLPFISKMVCLFGRRFVERDMVRTLNKGGILGVVMDQRPAGGRKTSVDFLGRKTDFVCGPAIAARKANCPVYSVFCVKKGPMHYELISSEVVPASGCDDEVNALTQGMATAIERTVDLYPDQWTWHYDRWKINKAYA